MTDDHHEEAPLNLESSANSQGPVECLGMTFESDEERREYFLGKLREKLEDPEFREIEGFPIGEDEDILALSDPPYYTACPNPFIEDFIAHYGQPYDPETDDYRREPFASDTGSGKTHPIYTAHSYHSKIPHLATMPCILHYTKPGDIVLDGFSGSGMTGVAAQLCGEPEPEFKKTLEQEWKVAGYPAPEWGARRPILIDLSPVANFIAYNLNIDVSAEEFNEAADKFFKKLDSELGWMYETLHTDGERKGRINYVVWSEVFICPNCASDVIFMEQAYDPETGKFAGEFPCPSCQSTLTTRSCEHKFTTQFDEAINEMVSKVTYVPIEVEYTLPSGKAKYRKKLDEHDLALLDKLAKSIPIDRFPSNSIPEEIYHYSRLAPKGITHFHQFYLARALHALSAMWRIAEAWPNARVRNFLMFMVEQCFWGMTMMNRYGSNFYSQVNRFLGGVFYLPTLMSETSPWLILNGKYKRLQKMLNANHLPTSRQCTISTASSLQLPILDMSVDYIYTDLPFGDFVPYGDLNLLIEGWHQIFSNLSQEVLVDTKRDKSITVYRDMLYQAFAEYYRILKPGRWITIVFHNSKNSIWNMLQEAIGAARFVVADVRMMERGSSSYRQVTASNAIKSDVIISAYKPNGGLEERFKLTAGTEDGAWDFIRTHLKQLPVFVSKNEHVEVIAERQNHPLFDRMVAFHVRRGVTVPISAPDFYTGLENKFPARDGMYFLPDQVAEYDKKRMTVKDVLQLELFVFDEASSIQWLRQQLDKKPQAFQEIHPLFLKETTSGWQEYEKHPELIELLRENFLPYDGQGDVPSQIHRYLSSNYKEFRNLGKNDPVLKAKAKDRWYVPDPNKASDIEKLRERTLLREFEEYLGSKQRRLKVFRSEAVRAGFKKAWQDNDYNTIIAVAHKIHENVLQEDPKLLMWYDQALTRVGDNP